MNGKYIPAGENKHGIPKVVVGPKKSGGRRCVVPWKHKIKRVFGSENEAMQFAAVNDPTLQAYKCKRHKGWHLGHHYEKGNDA